MIIAYGNAVLYIFAPTCQTEQRLFLLIALQFPSIDMTSEITVPYRNTTDSDDYLKPSQTDPWTYFTTAFVSTALTNLVIILIASFIIVYIILKVLRKRAKRREERDKLSAIIQQHYWVHEEQLLKLIQALNKLKQNILFRDVNELHVVAYKYRIENDVYGPRENFTPDADKKLKYTQSPYMDALLLVIKKIEHLFDTLMMQLPCEGTCSYNIISVFGSTAYALAMNTAVLWYDHKSRIIRHVLGYLASSEAVQHFDAALITDEALEALVLARLPYVNQLMLNDDHFVLYEVEVTSDLKVDLKNKLRFVDIILAKCNLNLLQAKEKNLTECYYSARELCMKHNFIQNKHNLPDIVTKVGEPSKIMECVVCLRHLLRIICLRKHIKKVENDDKFFQLLMQTHEAVYGLTDTDTMCEVLDRIRGNIICYVRGLTMEQMLMDREYTKVKLEHLEKELYKHLNYLTLKQVHLEKMRQSGQDANFMEPRLYNTGSDSSIYTMALSASSFMMQRQPSLEHNPHLFGEHSARLHHLEMMRQQRSLDQGSVISSNSLYGTAMSLSSMGNLDSTRRAPSPTSMLGTQAESPPSSRSPLLGPSSRPTSPPLIEGNEYFETAV